jgi:hypothetical protein
VGRWAHATEGMGSERVRLVTGRRGVPSSRTPRLHGLGDGGDVHEPGHVPLALGCDADDVAPIRPPGHHDAAGVRADGGADFGDVIEQARGGGTVRGEIRCCDLEAAGSRMRRTQFQSAGLPHMPCTSTALRGVRGWAASMG